MRRIGVGIGTAIAVVSLVGVAQAETFKGGIKGEPKASLSVIVKKIEGTRYVTRIEFKKVPITCKEGETTTTSGTGTTNANPGLEVAESEFAGKWEYGKVDGKFKGGGKLKGEITIKADGGDLGECKSGKLEYVVFD